MCFDFFVGCRLCGVVIVLEPCGRCTSEYVWLCSCYMACSVMLLVISGGNSGLCVFFAGMKVYVSLGVICVRTVVSQNWQYLLRAGWCDLSFFLSGVAWRSPPMSMVMSLWVVSMSCCIHVRTSRYFFS